ncbi:hypothetical protein BT63DRAFT_428833 [Microthyrium microscopicum]|uniref:Uncharacterized protein n=1 Tax=Microthyrium microscopicum TaxID=703497 RepID=A0A6A6TZN7_9PEZI|nr:hypothetical protein BT63DRAFT_428833 [Microthyrium microscopicum]
MKPVLLDEPEQIAKLIGELEDYQKLLQRNVQIPQLYMSTMGVKLHPTVPVSFLTVLLGRCLLFDTTRCFIIDVKTLGAKAFNTPGTSKRTLKDILCDETSSKVFFDVRNASHVLSTSFGISLKGVSDLQLMENAWRRTSKSREFLGGLVECVQSTLRHTYFIEFASWMKTYKEGNLYLRNEKDNSLCIMFNYRPVRDQVKEYCVANIEHLQKLSKNYSTKVLSGEDWVRDATRKRVVESQDPDFKHPGLQQELAPWSEKQHESFDKTYRSSSALRRWEIERQPRQPILEREVGRDFVIDWLSRLFSGH